MKRYILSVFIGILALSMVFLGSSYTQATAKETTLLEFNTMVGVPVPYTGATNAIRGVPGGGLPWVLSSAVGELKASGKLEISVRGLVLAAGSNAGKNPITSFRGLVSCLSIDANGAPTTVNVLTDPFPASLAGNSNIEATVSLPRPCIAPIVFVTSPGGAWFAATGN
jgi:hypothetical protein